MKAERIAEVAICWNELVQRVVLARVDIDNVRYHQTGTDAAQRGCDDELK